MSQLSVGLALGGGGARGSAHIGVLQVLVQHSICIDKIAGTSAGSVIGAMFAATKDPDWIEKRFREFLDSPEFNRMGTKSLQNDRDPDSVFGQVAKYVQDKFVIVMALNRISVVKRERLEQAIDFLLPVKSFDELKIPLEVYATDLQTGDQIRYDSGNLVEAVVQSSSIPGYVPPTSLNGRKLVDGGVSSPIPVLGLKQEVDYVIAVDISRGIPKPLDSINIIDIITRAERITSTYLTSLLSKQADFVFRPNVMGLHWSQFDEFETLKQNGIKEAGEKIEALKKSIKYRSSWLYWLKQWFGGKK